MMEHYVTLFDSLFLPQGIALHASMERHAGQYTLWILCMDALAYEVLQRISLPNVRLLCIEQLETNELRRVKAERTKAEYCWTLTPFTPRFVFETDPTAERVTYIDADMWFRKSPSPIFLEFELSGKQVLITDHGYAPEHDQSATSGQFCVQFMTFNRVGGEIVRKWWEERCIEWCYARAEDGKFGDQKYLDDWGERFVGQVHILQHQEWMLAPWNSIRFPYNGAICHHFHGLRIVDNRSVTIAEQYAIPQPTREYLYMPYLNDIKNSLATLNSVGHTAMAQQKIIQKSKIKRICAKLIALSQHSWRYAPEPIIRFE